MQPSTGTVINVKACKYETPTEINTAQHLLKWKKIVFSAKNQLWVTDGETILHPADKLRNCQGLEVQK